MYEIVLYEKDNGVANIALNRPEKLNAFDGTLHDELYKALGEAAEETRSAVSFCGARVVVSPPAPTWRSSSRRRMETPTSVNTCAARTAAS